MPVCPPLGAIKPHDKGGQTLPCCSSLHAHTSLLDPRRSSSLRPAQGAPSRVPLEAEPRGTGGMAEVEWGGPYPRSRGPMAPAFPALHRVPSALTWKMSEAGQPAGTRQDPPPLQLTASRGGKGLGLLPG